MLSVGTRFIASKGGCRGPLTGRFFGEKSPRPRRGGGGDGLGGDPCGRPRSCRWQDEGRPQGSPPHIPTTPAPTGTQPLPRHVGKKPTRERCRGLPASLIRPPPRGTR